MKKHNQLILLIREVIFLIIKFFAPYGIKNEQILELPTNVKRMGIKIGLITVGLTVIALAFSFLLKLTNLMIEHKLILLGIILFMLYRGQQVVREAFYIYESSEDKKFEQILQDEIILRGSNIIGKTADKVMKFDEKSGISKLMSNEAVLNTIKNYMGNLWQQRIKHIMDIIQIISVIAMLVVAIVTNTAISQQVFIPMIIGFCILSFFSSAYISLKRKEYYQKNREFDNQQSVVINDLLRVPAIVQKDIEMRINKFQNSVINSNKNVVKFHKQMNLSRLLITIIECFSQYGIIVFYLLGIEWSTITVATIAEISAVLIIVETALAYIGDIAEILNQHCERSIVLEKEEKYMLLILDVYHRENNKISESKHVDCIKLKPFRISYLEESENDKPFTLESKKSIEIEKGEVAVLYGPSGSGKSTFMKMLTERIRLEKSVDIPATSRYMFYDEKLKFGSLNIFDELFCSSENPDLLKMQNILENLHLWQEIKSNCIDVWVWMKEKQFGHTLSNGQKQRLIIAKMLYWLDDEIDVVVLDECTSGLDDKSETDSADAERILEYIIQYCNKDKQRIVIISTHQNIDGVEEDLSTNYTFRKLDFIKDKESNIIRELLPS